MDDACTTDRGWRERRYDLLASAGVVPGQQCLGVSCSAAFCGCSLIRRTSTLGTGQPLLDLTFAGNQKGVRCDKQRLVITRRVGRLARSVFNSKLQVALGGKREGSLHLAVSETFRFVTSRGSTPFPISRLNTPVCGPVIAEANQTRAIPGTGSRLEIFSLIPRRPQFRRAAYQGNPRTRRSDRAACLLSR